MSGASCLLLARTIRPPTLFPTNIRESYLPRIEERWVLLSSTLVIEFRAEVEVFHRADTWHGTTWPDQPTALSLAWLGVRCLCFPFTLSANRLCVGSPEGQPRYST